MSTRAVAVLASAALVLAGCGGGAAVDRAGEAPAPAAGASDRSAPGGDAALAFSAPTLDGGHLDASTLAGKPVVLWFWAPWCTICRTEGPDVAQVARDLQGDVTVLGVPGRGSTEDMRAFVQDTGTAELQHVVDGDGSLWQRFRVVTQPAYAFVSPAGEVELFSGALGSEELRTRAAALSTS